MSAETYEFGTAATFLPTHAEYEPLVKACWSGTSVAVRPAAIVTPTSTEEMAAVMRQLVKKGLTFTVRSGGTARPDPTCTMNAQRKKDLNQRRIAIGWLSVTCNPNFQKWMVQLQDFFGATTAM